MAVPLASRVVRGVIGLAALAAAFTMLRCYQHVELENGWQYTKTYSDLGTFEFFMVANIIFGTYSLVTALLPPDKKIWIAVLVLDVVMWGLTLAAACGTGIDYGHLSKGNASVPWAPICRVTPDFCSCVLGSFIAGVIGFSMHCTFNVYSFLVIFGFL